MRNFNSIRENSPKSIVILRALQIGDMLCSIPAFRALRSALPNSEITLIGLPWARNFVTRFPYYFDHFEEFPGFPGLPEQTARTRLLPGFLKKIQDHNFDLCIQMHGSGTISNPLIATFNGRTNAGYYLPGQFCPDPIRFLPYPVHLNEIKRHLKLMEYLGIENLGSELEFPITPRERDEADEIMHQYGLPKEGFVCIHPGARSNERRWPLERFAELGDELVERGFEVVITGSTEETELGNCMKALMKKPSVNLTGKTSLGGLAAVLEKSKLLVSNDTGVSHLAAALKVPSVVIFTTSDPKRWAPLNQQLHRVISWGLLTSAQGVLLEVDDILGEVIQHVS